MSYKDKLKQSQGGSSFIRLPIEQIYDVKEKDSVPGFKYWDAANKEQRFTTENILGVFLGRAFKASAFDPSYGRNGGSWETGFYFSNKSVVLFNPEGQFKTKGTMEDVENYLKKEIGGITLKKKFCLFILQGDGAIVVVITNMTLAIDQLSQIDKGVFADNLMLLEADIYSADDATIKRKAHEFLGKLAAKNPPCFVRVKVGLPITDKLADEIDLETNIDLFMEWKAQQEGQSAPHNATPPDLLEDVVVPDIPEYHDEKSPEPPVDDDLPF